MSSLKILLPLNVVHGIWGVLGLAFWGDIHLIAVVGWYNCICHLEKLFECSSWVHELGTQIPPLEIQTSQAAPDNVSVLVFSVHVLK